MARKTPKKPCKQGAMTTKSETSSQLDGRVPRQAAGASSAGAPAEALVLAGVRDTLGDIVKELSSLEIEHLFIDCADCTEQIHRLCYQPGEPIVKDHELVAPASQYLPQLDTNPLLLVIKGYVEVYYKDDFGTPIAPALVVGPGETFGEFEMSALDDEDPEIEPELYAAEAMAAFKTVHPLTAFGNKDAWATLAPEIPKSDFSGLFHSTLHRFLPSFQTEVALIPYNLVRELAKDQKFALRFYKPFHRRLKTLLRTNPRLSISENDFEAHRVAKHFVKHTLPALSRGESPVLVSCEAYTELLSWWNQVHQYLKSTKGVHPPFNFLVPANGETAKRVFTDASTTGLPPFLSCLMLQRLTGLKEGNIETFVEEVNKIGRSSDSWLLHKPNAPSPAEKAKQEKRLVDFEKHAMTLKVAEIKATLAERKMVVAELGRRRMEQLTNLRLLKPKDNCDIKTVPTGEIYCLIRASSCLANDK